MPAGGGTPSLLPPHLLQEILRLLQSRFGVTDAAEISMEADPGTFDLARIKGYQDVGIQRFSVGIQAFDEVRPLSTICHTSCVVARWKYHVSWASDPLTVHAPGANGS